jgi:arylsulfatase A-like enzyme
VLAVAGALLAPRPADGAEVPADRPNILVFMTDDQTYGTFDVMPTVRSLQARGTTFTRYYDSNPLCCPTRAAFLTGQYSHNNGVWDNQGARGGYRALVDKDNTVAAWLHDAGYQTALLGKFLNGYDYDRFGIPAGWDRWRLASPMFAYDETRILDENGDVTDYGSATYRTDLEANLAVDLLDQLDPDRPWFMWLTPNAPHSGAPVDVGDVPGQPSCSPSPAWQGFDAGRPAPHRAQFNEADVTDKPRHIRRLPLLSQASRTAVRSAYWQHLECLRSADEYLAAVLDHLAEIGELDDTDVIVLSDNGYAFGEHRVRYGKRLPYAYASHIPLVAAGPDFAAGVDDLPRSSVDLAPTLLALSGATAGRVVDGRPLTAPVSDDRLIMNEGREPKPNHPRYSVVEYVGIRTPTWLYAHYDYAAGDDEYELYNLVDDPNELRSRGRSTKATYVQKRKSFESLLRSLRSCAGATCP